MFEDNKGAIDIAKTPLSSSNSKPIDVRYHVLRELVAEGDLSVKWLRAKYQQSDILTIAVARERFEKHRVFCWGYRFSFRCRMFLVDISEACWLIKRQGRCSM